MTPEEWAVVKHFRPSEFDSPDAPGSGRGMAASFVQTLDLMREACGFPFVIHSGFRTLAYNAQLSDAAPGSAHTKGLAADIGAATSGMRMTMIREAFRRGFTRIGIGKTFVHLDIDKSLPQGMMWLYP